MDEHIRLVDATKYTTFSDNEITTGIPAGTLSQTLAYIYNNSVSGTVLVKPWIAGVQIENSLVVYTGNLYRVKQNIANGQAPPQGNTQYYQQLADVANNLVVEQDLSSKSTTSVPSVKSVSDALLTVGNYTAGDNIDITNKVITATGIVNKVDKYVIDGTAYPSMYDAIQHLYANATLSVRGDISEQLTYPTLSYSTIDANSAVFSGYSTLSIGDYTGSTLPYTLNIIGCTFLGRLGFNSNASTTKNRLIIRDASLTGSANFTFNTQNIPANNIIDEIEFIRLKGVKDSPIDGVNLFRFLGNTYNNDRPLKIIFTDCDIESTVGTLFSGFTPRGTKIYLRGTTKIKGLGGNNLATGLRTLDTGSLQSGGQAVQYLESEIIVDERPAPSTIVIEQNLSSNSTTSVPSVAAVKLAVDSVTINDSNFVHKTGNETIAGDKTFTDFLQGTNIRADFFYGDGSRLTNAGPRSTDFLPEGTSNQYYTDAKLDKLIRTNYTRYFALDYTSEIYVYSGLPSYSLSFGSSYYVTDGYTYNVSVPIPPTSGILPDTGGIIGIRYANRVGTAATISFKNNVVIYDTTSGLGVSTSTYTLNPGDFILIARATMFPVSSGNIAYGLIYAGNTYGLSSSSSAPASITLNKIPTVTLATDGAQTITLPSTAKSIVTLMVLEIGGYTRTIWDDYYTLTGTTLTISSDANLKKDDKITGKYY